MRGRTILAIADVLLFFFSRSTPLALASVLLWGVVASIGYCAFLGGPPLIRIPAPELTVRQALVAVAVAVGQLWSPDPGGPVLRKSGETR